MKTFSELTKAALAARKNTISRSEFLASLDPAERSDAAMQYDRAGRLDAEIKTLPTEAEITEEATRIARVSRMAEWCEEHSRYGADLFERMNSGRIMSAGMSRQSSEAQAYADQVTPAEITAARPRAIENLNVDRDHLSARLGLPQ